MKKKTETLEVPIAEIEFSDLNANRHEGQVADALKESMREYGLTSIPLLMRKRGGKGYRCISGEHRTLAWASLGNETIQAVVQPYKKLTKEEEFNLVQNYNAIAGKMDLSAVRRMVKENRLDLSQINVVGLNPATLFPNAAGEARAGQIRNREARLRLLAAEIAESIAALIIDEKEDVGVMLLEAKDRLVVVCSMGEELTFFRRNRKKLKAVGQDVLTQALEIHEAARGGNKE